MRKTPEVTEALALVVQDLLEHAVEGSDWTLVNAASRVVKQIAEPEEQPAEADPTKPRPAKAKPKAKPKASGDLEPPTSVGRRLG